MKLFMIVSALAAVSTLVAALPNPQISREYAESMALEARKGGGIGDLLEVGIEQAVKGIKA
jgi:hypothetical protein